jgi:tetratricopeptide (TPR) repeat protein
VQGKDQGQTGEDGRLTISDYVHILDSAKVKLSKSGFDDLSRDIYLADADNIDSLTMVKRTASSRPEVTAPSRPEVTTPSRPGSDFQTYINAARNYLDRAISGESRYFGRALTEIDKAINANPRSIPARQIKVEILFNFAKSLRESNLPREAINRLGEAQKIYRNIPQDPLYFEIDKLKKELEKEQGG